MPLTEKRPTSSPDAPGPLIRKRVRSLKPSPENELLYRAISLSDPDIEALAESIKANGCAPLVVTLDGYIASGNRRHAALRRNGQAFVSCFVLPKRRDQYSKDEYIALLAAYNLQRHKSVAEQVAEELADINPETAMQQLRNLREESVRRLERYLIPTMEIEGTKKRYNISDEKAEHVKHIKKVVFEDREDYWPLSVRGVHYALMNYEFLRNIPRKLPYKNDDESYGATSDLCTRLRIDGTLPWDAFDDGTRPLTTFPAFDNVRDYIRQELANFLCGYWRKLEQTQPNHIELVCEKNTIYNLVLRVTEKYHINTSSGRGFNGIDPWHDLYQRYLASGKERLIVIVLSDYDPEGQMIPQVGGRTLRDDFGVRDLTIVQAGITPEQIEKYKLPEQNFAKETSSNLKWFLEMTGGNDAVYELESLNPKDLMNDLEGVLQCVLDYDLFCGEVKVEKEEAAYLEAVRKTALEALKGIQP